jgi:hypothetical protein
VQAPPDHTRCGCSRRWELFSFVGLLLDDDRAMHAAPNRTRMRRLLGRILIGHILFGALRQRYGFYRFHALRLSPKLWIKVLFWLGFGLH